MEIKIEEQEKQMAIGFRFATTQMKLAKEMNSIIQNLRLYINEMNGEIAGPPFLIYHNMEKQLDVTVAFSIKKEIEGSNQYKIIYTDSGKAVTAVHQGVYIWLRKAYKKMTKYMNDNKLEPAYLAYEYYYNSPGEVKTKDLKTKVVLYIK